MDQTETIFSGFFAAMAGILIFVLLIGLIISIITIIGGWKMLEKAGKPGWGIIIPIYNSILLCEISGVNPWWLLIVFLGSMIGPWIPIVGALLSLVISVYFGVLLSVSLAKSFGKENWFAVILYFFAPIGYCILGFGKDSNYVGKRPMHDIVFDEWFNSNKGNNTYNTNTNVKDATYTESSKFCPACGTKVANGTKYCPGCGKEM